MFAQAVPPFGATQCAADRIFDKKGNTSIVCTAGDVSITGIAIVTGSGLNTDIGENKASSTSCIAGTSPNYDFNLTMNFAVPDRWDVGIFLVNDGKDPHARTVDGGPATCSVNVLGTPLGTPANYPFTVAPSVRPSLLPAIPQAYYDFPDLDGVPTGNPADTCGDGNGAINGGTSSGHHLMSDVTVRCQANPLSLGRLVVPFVVSWDNQATPSGDICTSNLDPVPNTVSKCNSPNQGIQVDVDKETLEIVVVPPMKKTDYKLTSSIGETNVYDIQIDNVTGIVLANTKFTDVPVLGLTVTGVTCTSLPAGTSYVNGGASTAAGVCPAAGLVTVANLQGAGISLPDQPIASVIKFTVTAKVNIAAPNPIINKACVTVIAPSIVTPGTTFSGSSCAEDSDTRGASPTLTLVKTVTNNDGGTKVVADFKLTATGDDATITGASADASVTSKLVPSGAYVLSETFSTGAPVKGYGATWSCPGATSLVGTTVTLNAGQNVTCTVNNNDDAGKLTIRKTTKGAIAPSAIAFTFTGTNGVGVLTTPAISANNTPTSTGQASFGSSNTITYLTETLPDNTWAITAASCTDANGEANGNGTGAFNVPFNQTNAIAPSIIFDGITYTNVAANTVIIPAARVRGGADLTCDITNSRRTLTLIKQFVPTVAPATTTVSLIITDSTPTVINTTTAVTNGGGTAGPVAISGLAHTLTETATTGALYSGSNKRVLFYNCIDGKGNTLLAPASTDLSTSTTTYTTPSFTPTALGTGSAALDDKNLTISCEFKNVLDGTIIIKKLAIPDSTQAFSFATTGTGTLAAPLATATTFTLWGTNSGVSYTTTCATSNCNVISADGTMSNNQTFIYTETPPADWVVSARSCSGSGGIGIDTTTVANQIKVTGTGSTDYAMCTFTNKRLTAITVKKVVDGNTTDNFDLKASISNGAAATSTAVTSPAAKAAGNFKNGDSGKVILGSGAFPSINVAEVVNSNYTTTLTCTDDNTGAVVSGISGLNYTTGDINLSLVDTQQATCTFTNKRKTFLQVVKAVTSRVVSTDDFTVSINNGGGSAATVLTNAASTPATFEATPGTTYTLKELNTLGVTPAVDFSKYTSSYNCTGATAAPVACAGTTGTCLTIIPATGDNIVCTFTNAAKPATVKLTKTTSGGFSGAGENFGFTLTNTTLNSPNTVSTVAVDSPVQVDGNNVTAGAQNFTVSTANGSTPVTINESTIPSGWTMTSAGCSGLNGTDVVTVAGNQITIPATSVIASATIECNFTNTKKATVTVIKSIPAGSDDGTKFDLFVKQGATVLGSITNIGNGGTTAAIEVPAGQAVSISETVNTGTPLSKYTSTVNCPSTSLLNIAYNPASPPSFIPSVAQAVICTITNSLQPKLKLVKKVVGYTAPTDKFIVSSNPVGLSATVEGADGDGETTVFVATAGTAYTFTETAGVSTPVTSLANYVTTYSCTNANASSSTTLPSGTGLTFSVTPTFKDDITCTYTNTSTTGRIRLIKALSVARPAGDTDEFTVQIKDSGNAVVNVTTNSTSAGAGSAVTTGTGDTGAKAYAAGIYKLTEIAAGTTTLTNYGAKLKCTNHGVAITTPKIAVTDSTTFVAGTDQSLTLAAGDDVFCILTNGAPAGTGVPLTIKKTTIGGTGAFSFGITGGTTATVNITTAAVNTPVSGSATLTATASATVVTETPVPAGWAVTLASCTVKNTVTGVEIKYTGSNAVTIPTVEASGKTYECNFTNTKIGPSITGTVFKDNGISTLLAPGGVANDGIHNGAETGIPKVTVKLTDCTVPLTPANIYSTAITDGNGNYNLAIPTAAEGKTVCVEEFNASGYLSTGSNIAGSRTTPNGIYTLESVDKIKFDLVANTSYTGLNFADVPVSRFLTDGAKTGQPGTTVSYPHIFFAGSKGTVTFSFASAIPSPTMTGWHETLYKDTNCDGVLNTAAGDSLVTATAISVDPDQRICLIVKEFIPATAPLGASNLIKIQADFVYTDANPALNATYTRQDLTRVTDLALDLLKKVCLVDSMTDVTDPSSCTISNTAKSGQKLEYQIIYTNNAPTPIKNLIINDATPTYTTFVLAACGTTTPTGLTCNAPSTPAVGGTGSIQWTFTGSLAPGASGNVTFRVKVD